MEDHIGLTSRGELFFDKYATVGPPFDFCFARYYNDSNGLFNVSTSARLATFTFRRFAVAAGRNSHVTGPGVNSSKRLPPTPPHATQMGQPGTQWA